eukprot:CAMPEP_0177679142 /NCGR_PEP_ID=MMETSP0447-20121125/29433_1 /TAXON_ID=0 /ORGANISM="Stygamoeba regulata, Strain BSH-02190019" /LENGTH=47 /DNA_ID= /DNA_START= /DNA_END= /DNA_ORIENTATION=
MAIADDDAVTKLTQSQQTQKDMLKPSLDMRPREKSGDWTDASGSATA